MTVHAYHPETGHELAVTDEQMAHMRRSGWVLKTEHEERQAAAQAAADAAAKGKPAKDERK